MPGIFATGPIGLLALVAVQAQQPPQFLNATLKTGVEAGKGFFAVTGNAVQIGRATYLMSSGNVTTGSTITPEGYRRTFSRLL